MLKENIVMPGPIFIMFSLPPYWLYFLTGISGLAFSNLFRQFPSLKSYWSYLPSYWLFQYFPLLLDD